MKNQKGITLIALVITIIIMSILVAVTVTIAMQGGLFTKAKEAKTSTQYATEKEELLIYTLGDYYNAGTNELNISGLANDPAFTNSWNIVNSTSDYIEVTRKGNGSGVTFKIYKAGGAITDNYGSEGGTNTPTVNPNEQTGSEDLKIVGTYWLTASAPVELIIKNNNQFEAYAYGNKVDSGTFEFNSTNNTAIISTSSGTVNANFYEIIDAGNVVNKVIVYNGDDEKQIFTSNGTVGLTSIAGTYVESSNSHQYLVFDEETPSAEKKYFSFARWNSGSRDSENYIIFNGEIYVVDGRYKLDNIK